MHFDRNNKLGILQKYWTIFVIGFIYLTLKVVFLNFGMFWDSVLVISKPAHYLFTHGLFEFNYPTEINNGDPQLVPFYLALTWKIFGRSLLISHIAYLPIILLTIWQLHKLTELLFPKKNASFVFLLILVDPTLMTQLLGLYQDTFLILFSVLIINSMLKNKMWRIMIFMLMLCMVSRRGILLTFGFMLVNYISIIIFQKQTIIQATKKVILPYLPAIAFVVLFMLWRLHMFGWYFTTDATDTGKLVPLKGVFRNLLILGRWFTDCGRIFNWLIIFYVLYKIKNRTLILKENKVLILSFVILLLVMASVTLPIANPFGARYFAIHYLLLSILVSRLIISLFDAKLANRLILINSVLILSSNLWVYPEKLAYPWDASLKHIPYFELRQTTTNYFEANNIPLNEVGVGFPMYASFSYIDISNDSRKYSEFDFKKNKWAIYSNIYNMTDDEISELQKWTLIKEFNTAGVFMRIYKNPH